MVDNNGSSKRLSDDELNFLLRNFILTGSEKLAKNTNLEGSHSIDYLNFLNDVLSTQAYEKKDMLEETLNLEESSLLNNFSLMSSVESLTQANIKTAFFEVISNYERLINKYNLRLENCSDKQSVQIFQEKLHSDLLMHLKYSYYTIEIDNNTNNCKLIEAFSESKEKPISPKPPQSVQRSRLIPFSTEGHSIVLSIKEDSHEGFEITIFNSGEGNQFHNHYIEEKVQRFDYKLVFLIKKIEETTPSSKEYFREELLSFLGQAKQNKVRTEIFYARFIAFLSEYCPSGYEVSKKPFDHSEPIRYMKDQYSGSCVAKSLTRSLFLDFLDNFLQEQNIKLTRELFLLFKDSFKIYLYQRNISYAQQFASRFNEITRPNISGSESHPHKFQVALHDDFFYPHQEQLEEPMQSITKNSPKPSTLLEKYNYLVELNKKCENLLKKSLYEQVFTEIYNFTFQLNLEDIFQDLEIFLNQTEDEAVSYNQWLEYSNTLSRLINHFIFVMNNKKESINGTF